MFLKDEEPFPYNSLRAASKNLMPMRPLELPLLGSQGGRWRGLPYGVWLMEDHRELFPLQRRFLQYLESIFNYLVLAEVFR